MTSVFNIAISPALALMKRLRYSYKFLLISAFFAVPLMLSVAQLVLELEANIEEADQQRLAIIKLQEINQLLQSQENLRDLGVLHFLLNDDTLAQRFSDKKRRVLKHLHTLIQQSEQSASQKSALLNLQQKSTDFQIMPGMEAVRIRVLFDNAQQFVDLAQDYRRTILNQSGLLSGEHPEIFALLDLVSSDLPNVLEAMGEVRVFGVYYLHVNYLDSGGIETTDLLYQSLDQAHHNLTRKLDSLRQEYPHLKTLLAPEVLTQPIGVARDELDSALIQAFTLDKEWRLFEQRLHSQIDQLYQAIDQILQRVDRQLSDLREQESQRLALFLGGLGLLILLFLVLFYVLYRSLHETIVQLRQAALAVARGNYELAFTVDTKDEMRELALAMEEMRIQLKTREDKLYLISTTDALTGLRNRKYFDETLAREWMRATRCQHPLSILLIDVDHFKAVNDTYGHQTGDLVLQEIAAHLMHTMTRSMDVVTRYGGEEMAVLLPETPLDGAWHLAEQLRQRVEQADYNSDEHRLKITISIGIATCIPTPQTQAKELVSEADQALYRAKAEGRNRCQSLTPIPENVSFPCQI